MGIVLPGQQSLGADPFHRVCFPGSGLAIGKHRAVIALEHFTDQGLNHAFVHVDLSGVLAEGSVESESSFMMTFDGDALPRLRDIDAHLTPRLALLFVDRSVTGTKDSYPSMLKHVRKHTPRISPAAISPGYELRVIGDIRSPGITRQNRFPTESSQSER